MCCLQHCSKLTRARAHTHTHTYIYIYIYDKLRVIKIFVDVSYCDNTVGIKQQIRSNYILFIMNTFIV
jgi:hypothetical protein